MILIQIILQYLKIGLIPLSTFLVMQNIKSPIIKANEQVKQKSSLFGAQS